MSPFMEAATEFLSHRRIAIAGVSRDGQNPGNLIYRKLRDNGFQVFAVHPTATEIEGDRSYRSLAEIAGGVDGVVITTHPDVSASLVRECVALGIPRVWLHRSIGLGSFSAEAVALCEEHGIALLEGGCPMMVVKPDVGHACMRGFMRLTGKLPKGKHFRVQEPATPA